MSVKKHPNVINDIGKIIISGIAHPNLQDRVGCLFPPGGVSGEGEAAGVSNDRINRLRSGIIVSGVIVAPLLNWADLVAGTLLP